MPAMLGTTQSSRMTRSLLNESSRWSPSRYLPIAFVLALFIGAALITPASSFATSEGCENEARRVEQNSTFLSDCRAYELLTPSSTAPTAEHLQYGNGEPDFESTFTGLPEGSGEAGRGGYEIKDLTPMLATTVTASDGNAFLFTSPEKPGPSLARCGCMSRRTSSGWVGEDPLPTVSSVTVFCLGSAAVDGFSADLEKTVMVVGGEGERCGHAEPPLVSGEPGELDSNQQNLFLRDAAGSYQLLDSAPPGVVPRNRFDAISADGSHVVFESSSPLTEGTPEGGFTNIYVWGAAQPHSLHLLTVLPDGTPVHGPGEGGAYLAGAMNKFQTGTSPAEIETEAVIGSGGGLAQSAEANHAISSNGERVLFYAGGRTVEGEAAGHYSGGGLYLREHPAAEQSATNECNEPEKACTLQIDEEEQTCSTCSSGGGQFQWASADTSKIFFTDEEKLTADSTAAPGKPDLYEYDVEKPKGQRLTDLTANASEPADVRGVSGASQDGSYLYFVASGDLTGAQQNSHGATALAPAQGTGTLTSGSTEVTATSGAFHVGMGITGAGIPERVWITAVGAGTLTLSQPAIESGTPALSAEARNLYLRHEGAATFIAALNPESPDICDWRMFCLTARVSQNGRFIAFNSVNSLTGYDNNPVRPTACNRGILDGSHPLAEWPCIEIFRYAAASGANGELTCASCHPDGSPPAAEFAYADIEKPAIESAPETFPFRLNHNVSDSGQVFFSTMEKLVPADENETWDAYDYSGGEGASAGLHLISSGNSPLPSYFEDATPDGSNVFFVTAQSLLRSDSRADYDLYDARVGGGFTAQAEGVSVAALRRPRSVPPAAERTAPAVLRGVRGAHWRREPRRRTCSARGQQAGEEPDAQAAAGPCFEGLHEALPPQAQAAPSL